MKRVLSLTKPQLERTRSRSETSDDAGRGTTSLAPPPAKNAELAAFLKQRRAELDPRASGIKVSARRRAKGLSRDEVAQIAGISVGWYGWLEQGRPLHPSAAVLESIAGALKLNKSERRHLFKLARPDLSMRATSTHSSRLSDAIRALIDGLTPHPAYAVNGAWDVLAENDAARSVFGSFYGVDACEPNVLARLFLDPAWRSLFVGHAKLLEAATAQFRATNATRLSDPRIRAFTDALAARSDEFAELWSHGALADLPARRKTLRHSELGLLSLDYSSFHPDSEPEDLRVTIYTPADARTRRRLGA